MKFSGARMTTTKTNPSCVPMNWLHYNQNQQQVVVYNPEWIRWPWPKQEGSGTGCDWPRSQQINGRARNKNKTKACVVPVPLNNTACVQQRGYKLSWCSQSKCQSVYVWVCVRARACVRVFSLIALLGISCAAESCIVLCNIIHLNSSALKEFSLERTKKLR